MKKKRITYGVYGMMEYQAIIKIGRATLKVLFTDGSMTSIGQNPAKYTTSDFLTQHAIENSSDFKRGRIQVVNTIELDEDVRIERNPAKPSTQTANVAAKAVIDNKPTEASSSHTTPVAEDVADETTEEADAGVVTPTDEADAETIEEEPETESETNVEEDTTSEETAAEDNTAEGKTEVEFTDNQEAKDYIFKNFGVKPGTMRNREDIKAVGATYGVKITFVNEK
ncbi:hypothetical protein [Phocaeicola plebeius]|jgi:hypothetical protein|uniref:hypothetical protein n=1 Tax=Phocaeicola plebeius TaxID=310297 RepID=UPI003AB70018